MLIHSLSVVHVHDVKELTLANGFLLVADVQHLGVVLLQVLLLLRKQGAIKLVVVSPTTDKVDGPVVEDGGATVLSAESL